MPRIIPTHTPWYGRLLAFALERRRRRKATDSLATLDARALADIGVDPSEIASIEAESRDLRGVVTRRRIAAVGAAR